MSTNSHWFYHAMTKGQMYADARRCKSCEGACMLYATLVETKFNLKREWAYIDSPRRRYKQPFNSRYKQRRDESIPHRYPYMTTLNRLQNRLLYSV